MTFFQIPSHCDSHQFMKCEEYINITKTHLLGSIVYNCFVGFKNDFYNTSTLLYTLKFNRFHKAQVFNNQGTPIGSVEGRDREWNFNELNISLFDYPTLDLTRMNMHISIDSNTYKTSKPKPKGFTQLVLDMNYLNDVTRKSHCNFKLLDCENIPVLIGCSLYKRNHFHCVTNLDTLHAFVIFCVKNWS